MTRDIIVIGASAGGIDALRTLVASLPSVPTEEGVKGASDEAAT